MTATHISISKIDHTHSLRLNSWVHSANEAGTDFPIQNLPLGMYRPLNSKAPFSPASAIGDFVIDLIKLADLQLLPTQVRIAIYACKGVGLNPLMQLSPEERIGLRHTLVNLLEENCGATTIAQVDTAMMPMDSVEMGLPCSIGDYTDFYTGIHHATAVGKLFRPDNPLLPNYKWVPIGYHGRGSSIGVNGQSFRRPIGQSKRPDSDTPDFGPSQRLDYELEIGALVGPGNEPGTPIAIDKAERHLFGLVLLNDWSARGFQAWEYQPLGPFLSKNFATTISAWVITQEALAPFRRPFSRPSTDPQPLPYLDGEGNRAHGALDIKLEVLVQTSSMRAHEQGPVKLMESNFVDSYWTLAQLLTHHTVNGCNLQPGDLLGSGTQSGPGTNQGGSLLELTQGGKSPITLPNGEQRTFLQDGDTVHLRGRCEATGYRSIGFGQCFGTVLPAVDH